MRLNVIQFMRLNVIRFMRLALLTIKKLWTIWRLKLKMYLN